MESHDSHKSRSKGMLKRTNAAPLSRLHDVEAMDDSEHALEHSSCDENDREDLVRVSGSDSNTDESEDDEGSSPSDGDSGSEGNLWMDAGDIDSDVGSSSSDEEAAGEKAGDPKLHANAGWADAMAKILRTSKPKGKKTIVLAKAKKLSQIAPSKTLGDVKEDCSFEIDGQISTEDNDIKPKVDESSAKSDIIHSKSKPRRRDHLAEGKVKPSILHRERERALSKIATKGVVQLFNAVREQQKDIGTKLKQANGSVRKEEKVLKSLDKRAFLDVLMGNAQSERVEDHVRTKPETDVKIEKQESSATWSVLRDNFLTGSNLKDWDKCGEIKLEDDIDEVELH